MYLEYSLNIFHQLHPLIFWTAYMATGCKGGYLVDIYISCTASLTNCTATGINSTATCFGTCLWGCFWIFSCSDLVSLLDDSVSVCVIYISSTFSFWIVYIQNYCQSHYSHQKMRMTAHIHYPMCPQLQTHYYLKTASSVFFHALFSSYKPSFYTPCGFPHKSYASYSFRNKKKNLTSAK